MSSLYDRYHSQHNKTYMYNLIVSMIKDEYKLDLSSNDVYNQFFETNFINTFKSVNTEDIKDLNNHLLTTQLDYVKNFMLKQPSLSKTEEVVEDKDYTLYSFKRNINLKTSNRHNYRIKSPIKNRSLQLEKVIIPIEDSSLFMNPTIIISINTTYIDLHLRGTMNLRNREYGIFTPYYDKSFTLTSDICSIQFKNQLLNVSKTCDVYKILESNNKKITLKTSSNEFKVNDYIRMCNFENIELSDTSQIKQQYKVVAIRDIDDNTVELKLNKETMGSVGLFVMNMALQNTLHLSYSE